MLKNVIQVKSETAIINDNVSAKLQGNVCENIIFEIQVNVPMKMVNI